VYGDGKSATPPFCVFIAVESGDCAGAGARNGERAGARRGWRNVVRRWLAHSRVKVEFAARRFSEPACAEISRYQAGPALVPNSLCRE
jgi:hypothetical protein